MDWITAICFLAAGSATFYIAAHDTRLRARRAWVFISAVYFIASAAYFIAALGWVK